jgi:NAD(P)-dependent dehydrogenase (short-subunit alcohol dehydrogenase family)
MSTCLNGLGDPPHAVNLHGQVAVVTGGGRGIGRTIAQTLAGAGARVAVMSRSADELGETVRLIKQAGGQAVSLTTDVADPEAITRSFAEVERSLGQLDLLVNNAAVPGPLGPFSETDSGEWWRVLEINLRGPMLCTRAVLPGMIQRRRGRIINIASGGGGMSIAYFSPYVVSKTALIRFTECIAAETRPFGVAAFAVGPGTVRTSMANYSLNSAEGRKWLPWFQRIFEGGLDAPPERPAALVSYLASGKADALSGLFLQTSDNLDELIAHVDQIRRDRLYSLRFRRLGTAPYNPALAAIIAEAEQARE